MSQNINVRAKIIKTLRKKIWINLHDFTLGNGFLDMTLKA